MPVTIITHKGKKIIFASYEDYRHSKESMIQSTVDVTNLALEQPEKHLLFLFDLTDATMSSGFMEASKKAAYKIFKNKTGSGAIIGITGVRKVILKGYNSLPVFKGRKMRPFDSKVEALQYLVSRAR